MRKHSNTTKSETPEGDRKTGARDRKQEAVVHPSLYLGRVSRAKMTRNVLRTPECLRIQTGRDRAAENLIKVKGGTGTEKDPRK